MWLSRHFFWRWGVNLPSFEGFESDWDSFRALFRQASQYESLDAAREVHAIRQMRRGDDEARGQLLQSLYLQIVHTAARFWRPGISPDDLVQEGCIGALEGMEYFDEQRCYRLGTFLKLYIQKRITEHLWAFTGVSDPPRTRREVMRKVKSQEEALFQDLGRRPSTQEIADRLGLPVWQVDVVQGERQYPASLREISRGKALVELLAPGEDLWGKSVRVRDEQLRMAAVREVLGKLPEREGKAAWLLFGCDGHKPISLRELTDYLPHTYHGVRTIHGKALRQVRQVLEGLQPEEPLANGKKGKRASSRRSPQSTQGVDISQQGD